MTWLVASSSSQDSQEREVSQRGYESPHYFFLCVLVREDSFIIVS